MFKLENKTAAIVITLLLTLSIAGAIAVPKANAANFPGTTIPTWAYLQVVPDQVGVGQNVLMVMWIDKPPPTANGILGDRWVNMTLKITDPDGTVQTSRTFQVGRRRWLHNQLCSH